MSSTVVIIRVYDNLRKQSGKKASLKCVVYLQRNIITLNTITQTERNLCELDLITLFTKLRRCNELNE